MPSTARCCKPSSSSAATSTPPPPSRPRPRGLWRARAAPAPRPANHAPENNFTASYHSYLHPHHRPDGELDDDRLCLSADDSDASSAASAPKRRRLASDTPPTSDDDVLYWDYSRKCSPHPERLDKWVTRSKVMDTTSTAGPGLNASQATASTSKSDQAQAQPTSCDIEDWEDLKELFAKAAEIYENQPPTEAMPLLRGVIHECHRFMRIYYDPSVVYAPPAPPEPQKHAQTPPEQRLIRDWLKERPPLYPPQSAEKERLARAKARAGTEDKEKKCKCKDLPTAFYTILGTTLFFFGNLIDQDPALSAPGEPDRPTPYWLAAIDVFEIGENLPIRTSGRGCPSAPEDWRMAIIWGRTLVCLTHEALAREKDAPPSAPASPTDPLAALAASFPFYIPTTPGPYGALLGGLGPPPTGTPDEPAWPRDSPFALIVERRLPRTGRMSLSNTTPDELMLIAKDQFSRGIFHMPHPLHHARRLAAPPPAPAAKALPAVFTCTPPLTAYYSSTAAAAAAASAEAAEGDAPEAAPARAASPPPPPALLPGETFSRAKELFTIVSEVLDVAERFPSPSSRASLASFADGVLSQMKLEAAAGERAGAYGSWAGAGALVLARGRANLVIGAAKAEEIEGRIEQGDADVWGCDEAVDGREALGVAIVYLEKAREALAARAEEEAAAAAAAAQETEQGEVVMVEADGDENGSDEEMDEDEEGPRVAVEGGFGEPSVEEKLEDVRQMLAEALLTLANLTEDATAREALYARAQAEGGDAIVLDEWEDEDGMDAE